MGDTKTRAVGSAVNPLQLASAGVALGLGLLLCSSPPARAEIAITTTVTYPVTAVVNTVVDASIVIANISSSVDDHRDVVIATILHTPSCGSKHDPECLVAVPGVFNIDDAVGRSGTACAGTRFAAGPPNPYNGEVQFIPSHEVVLGPA